MSKTPTIAMIPSAYKSGKVYSVLPTDGSGDFNFSRTSEATRVNQNGLIEKVGSNVPRIDYTDGGCPKLLLEPQSTNLILSSENISGTGWGYIGWTLTNDFISPNGTNNAYSILRTTGIGVSSSLSLLANTTYTYSVYIKNVDATNIQLRVQNAAGNLSGTESNCVVFQVTDQTNTSDFTRITHTFNTGDAGSYNLFLGYYSVGEYIVWGAQLEQQSYATSYIPTNGSTVTREAETANGAGDAATFNDSEGVLYAEISALANDVTIREIALSDGGTANRIEIRYSGSNIQGVVRFGASVIVLTYNLADTTEFTKVALKYKSGDYAFWVNGLELQVDTTTGTPTGLSELAFDDGNGNDDFYGNTKQIQYFDTALTDLELEEMTGFKSFVQMANYLNYTVI